MFSGTSSIFYQVPSILLFVVVLQCTDCIFMIGSIMVYRTYNYVCYVIIPVIGGIKDITVYIVCLYYIYLLVLL